MENTCSFKHWELAANSEQLLMKKSIKWQKAALKSGPIYTFIQYSPKTFESDEVGEKSKQIKSWTWTVSDKEHTDTHPFIADKNPATELYCWNAHFHWLTSHSWEYVAEFHPLTTDLSFQPFSYQLQFEGIVAAMKRQGEASRQGSAGRHNVAQLRVWDPKFRWGEWVVLLIRKINFH